MENYASKEETNVGITLISLIITVVVMLILVGVAINLSIGNNGIFKKSDEGAQIYKNATNNESVSLNSIEQEMGELISKYHSGSDGENNNPENPEDINNNNTGIIKEIDIVFTNENNGWTDYELGFTPSFVFLKIQNNGQHWVALENENANEGQKVYYSNYSTLSGVDTTGRLKFVDNGIQILVNNSQDSNIRKSNIICHKIRELKKYILVKSKLNVFFIFMNFYKKSLTKKFNQHIIKNINVVESRK